MIVEWFEVMGETMQAVLFPLAIVIAGFVVCSLLLVVLDFFGALLRARAVGRDALDDLEACECEEPERAGPDRGDWYESAELGGPKHGDDRD